MRRNPSSTRSPSRPGLRPIYHPSTHAPVNDLILRSPWWNALPWLAPLHPRALARQSQGAGTNIRPLATSEKQLQPLIVRSRVTWSLSLRAPALALARISAGRSCTSPLRPLCAAANLTSSRQNCLMLGLCVTCSFHTRARLEETAGFRGERRELIILSWSDETGWLELGLEIESLSSFHDVDDTLLVYYIQILYQRYDIHAILAFYMSRLTLSQWNPDFSLA